MDYQLAKQLKDAGYPQNIPFSRYLSVKGGGSDGPNGNELESTYARVPTLSELIEKIPKSFEEKGITYEFMLMYAKGVWLAGYSDPEFKSPTSITLDRIGKTPDEAVARVWLVTNEKS